MIRRYETTSTGLIITPCPVYDCTVGGYYCVNCNSFGGKSKEKGTIECSKEKANNKIGGLPPMRTTNNQ